MAGEVFKHIKKMGGVPAIEKINREKAKKLYDYIDSSSLYSCPVEVKDRSLMNVVFVTGNEALDKKFTKEAKAAGLHKPGRASFHWRYESKYLQCNAYGGCGNTDQLYEKI